MYELSGIQTCNASVRVAQDRTRHNFQSILQICYFFLQRISNNKCITESCTHVTIRSCDGYDQEIVKRRF